MFLSRMAETLNSPSRTAGLAQISLCEGSAGRVFDMVEKKYEISEWKLADCFMAEYILDLDGLCKLVIIEPGGLTSLSELNIFRDMNLVFPGARKSGLIPFSTIYLITLDFLEQWFWWHSLSKLCYHSSPYVRLHVIIVNDPSSGKDCLRLPLCLCQLQSELWSLRALIMDSTVML